MKKIFFVLILFFMTAGIVNAQYFAGGSFSFNTSGGETETPDTTMDNPSSTSFSFNPKGGMFLSEKLLVGLELSYSLSKSVTPGHPEVTDKSSSFGISPFARYYALNMGKFSIFGQANLGYSSSSSETTTGNTTTEGPKTNTIGLSAYPGLAYKLSDMVEIEAYINGLNFGLSRSKTTQTIAGDEITTKTTNFGLGASLDGILTTGGLSIGAIIKF